jgi:hypothetical protein
MLSQRRDAPLTEDANMAHCIRLFTADRRAADKELVTLLLQYPCGLVRGAMSALGHPASVKADFWDEKTDKSILPTVSFTVKLLPKQQPQQQQQQQP